MKLIKHALVSPTWQITIPVEVRRLLSLKEGDEILFTPDENNGYILSNASLGDACKEQQGDTDITDK